MLRLQLDRIISAADGQRQRALLGATDDTWMADAECRLQGTPVAWFYGHVADDTLAQVAEVCAVCPVQVECLEYAIATHQGHGIWGGAGPRERREIISSRRRAHQDRYQDQRTGTIGVPA